MRPVIDLTDVTEKLNLILERLSVNTAISLKEATEDTKEDITVEVDGETVVDTNENDVADTLESEVEITVDDNPASEIGPTLAVTQLLMDAIKDEYNTIQFYNDIIATASSEEGFDDVVRIMKHINEEEQIHVGMLQQLLKQYDTAAGEVETGKTEASDIIADQ